jgi:hypothetical protein
MTGTPWWNRVACTRCSQAVRSSSKSLYSRMVARASSTWAGGIHDSGRRPAQQLTQMPGVGSVGLGAPLGTAQAGGLGQLGHVRDDPGPLQFLDDVPPAGAALQREGHLLLAGEALQPGAQLPTVGG